MEEVCRRPDQVHRRAQVLGIMGWVAYGNHGMGNARFSYKLNNSEHSNTHPTIPHTHLPTHRPIHPPTHPPNPLGVLHLGSVAFDATKPDAATVVAATGGALSACEAVLGLQQSEHPPAFLRPWL